MKKFLLLVITLISLLFMLSILSICLGAVNISIKEIIENFQNKESTAYRIIRFVRLPRTIGAIFCGSALAVSGALIQNTLQNPLGSPNVLGMNSGAGLFVIISATIFPNIKWIIPSSAFLGAFGTLLLVSILGKKAGGSKGFSKHSLILSGVAANAFLSALSDGINTLIPDTIYSRTTFRIGSLSGVQTDIMFFAGIIIFISITLSYLMKNQLDILSLGDESAKSLGLNVEKTRLIALILASLLCGAGISFAGLIGFVGLIVPHCSKLICRRFKQVKTENIITISILIGANLVLLCDIISRIALSPYELPVGILLSLIGGPFFFYLLLKNRKVNYDKN